MTDTAHPNYNPGPIYYRGFLIHTRKKPGMKIYIASIYKPDRSMGEYRVAPADMPADTRKRIIEIAKYEIDQGRVGKCV